MMMNKSLRTALISCFLFTVSGSFNAWAQTVALDTGTVTDKKGRLNFKVINDREIPISVILRVEDAETKRAIPLDQWRTNIDPDAKDNDVVELKPKEFRYVSLQVKKPGRYYICYSARSNAMMQANNCKLIKFYNKQ